MTECEWCHDPVAAPTDVLVMRLLHGLGPARTRLIEEHWGTMPKLLCAQDFIQVATYANANV